MPSYSYACLWWQNSVGCVGTPDVLSTLRRPKEVRIGTATREGEQRRAVGVGGTPDTVSAGNYLPSTDVVTIRSPIVTIGKTKRGVRDPEVYDALSSSQVTALI